MHRPDRRYITNELPVASMALLSFLSLSSPIPSASKSIFLVGICFDVRKLSFRMDPLIPGISDAVGVFASLIAASVVAIAFMSVLGGGICCC